jgi:hypothetical protein
MSGTYEDMMTPEQARMMYAALLDKLPLNSPAAQSIGAGAGLPLELLSAQPPTDQTAAAAATAPVVTEGTAAQLPVPPIPPSEAPSAAPSEAPPDQTDPLGRLRSLVGGGERPSQEDRGRESLMNFFFSMAASRNPSFFGQLGEAGQALAQADRAARTEARQERQLDVEAAYRAAAEARQLREAAAMEDPSTPRGRLLNAQAAQAEATAAYYARRPAGEGGGSQRAISRGAPQVLVRDGQVIYFYPNTGESVPAPEGALPPNALSREESLRQRDIQNFGQLNRNNVQYQINPTKFAEDAEAYANAQAERRRAIRAPNQSAQQPNAPTEPQTRPGNISIPYVAP